MMSKRVSYRSPSFVSSCSSVRLGLVVLDFFSDEHLVVDVSIIMAVFCRERWRVYLYQGVDEFKKIDQSIDELLDGISLTTVMSQHNSEIGGKRHC